MIRISFVVIAALAMACSGASDRVPDDLQGADTAAGVVPAEPLNTETEGVIPQSGNEIPLSFEQPSSETMTIGKLDSANTRAVYLIPVESGKRLIATVSTENGGKANLRFNQIFRPDGKSDGPFGDQLSYVLTSTGTYKLVIGSSKMAEDPYVGNFILKVRIE
ncbi:MAG: hypothetical protein V4616_04510 [Bacteroidota bacterium]